MAWPGLLGEHPSTADTLAWLGPRRVVLHARGGAGLRPVRRLADDPRRGRARAAPEDSDGRAAGHRAAGLAQQAARRAGRARGARRWCSPSSPSAGPRTCCAARPRTSTASTSSWCSICPARCRRDGRPRRGPSGRPRGPAGRRRRPTRIDVAKDVLTDFVRRRKTDRIGVVVFAKQAFVLSPPTLDYGLIASLVSRIELGVIDSSKTAIGDAVGTAVARMRQEQRAEQGGRAAHRRRLERGDHLARVLGPPRPEGGGARLHRADRQRRRRRRPGGDGPLRPADLRAQALPGEPRALAGDGAGDGRRLVHRDRQARARARACTPSSTTWRRRKFESQASTMEDLFPLLARAGAWCSLALEALARLLLVGGSREVGARLRLAARRARGRLLRPRVRGVRRGGRMGGRTAVAGDAQVR